jgi:hypothetical protein
MMARVLSCVLGALVALAACVDCCAPSGPAGPLGCTDHAATVQAVADMAAAGVRVYVAGIPGSQAYAQVLTDMAK